jgi:hypothetical protein
MIDGILSAPWRSDLLGLCRRIPKIEFRAIMTAFLSIFRSFSPHSRWVNGQLSRSGGRCTSSPFLALGIIEGICRSFKGDHGEPFARTHGISAKSRSDSRQKNRLLFLTANAFHPDWDGCFMSLGGVDFAVFTGPSDADVEARVNSEYLWGRQIITIVYAILVRTFRVSKKLFPTLFPPNQNPPSIETGSGNEY